MSGTKGVLNDRGRFGSRLRRTQIPMQTRTNANNVPIFVRSTISSMLVNIAQTPTALLKCDMQWEARPARNIIGQITGSDPVMKDQIIVLEAYYDAMSIVPDEAPGAENACGIASLLELIKTFKKFPPKRTIWILATNGHVHAEALAWLADADREA